VYNDPKLVERVVGALKRSLGNDKVMSVQPLMVSEDFSYCDEGGVPTFMFWAGAVEPQKWAAAQKSGETLPSLHSAIFAPDLKPTLHTAMMGEISALLELMPKGK